MSETNTPPNPPTPSIREAVRRFLDARSQRRDPLASIEENEAEVDLIRALATPVASRPGLLPDVDHALGAIAAMKRGEPIIPEDIRAIVALAETGAEQLAEFDVRWDADMRAIKRWQEAHPQMVENVVWPDHADLVVWLMELFDCSFDEPTVAQVDQVRGRLKGAMQRAPNALTKDAGDIIDQLAEALRKTSRRAFIAEERIRTEAAEDEADRQSAIAALGDIRVRFDWPEQDSIDLATARELLTEAAALFRDVASRHGVEPRALSMAVRIEAFLGAAADQAAEPGEVADGGSVAIFPQVTRSPGDQAYAAMVAEARKNGVVDDAARVVWRSPGRAGALVATNLSQLTGYPIRDKAAPSQDGPSYDGAEAAPAIRDCRPEDEPIAGKNTADYDRRQLEERINAELASIAARYGDERIAIDIGSEVARFAPGWEYGIVPCSDPTRVTLVRYAPDEPL